MLSASNCRCLPCRPPHRATGASQQKRAEDHDDRQEGRRTERRPHAQDGGIEGIDQQGDDDTDIADIGPQVQQHIQFAPAVDGDDPSSDTRMPSVWPIVRRSRNRTRLTARFSSGEMDCTSSPFSACVNCRP